MAAKKSTGIYIGAKTVDVVQLEEAAGKARVTGFASKELSAQALKTEATVDTVNEELLGTVKKAMAEAKASGDEIYTALPAKDATLRFFKMAYLSAKEREQAVKFEARKYIPFKIDEVLSSFATVEENKKAGQMGILFAAAKRDAVSRHLIVLGRAGVRPKMLETTPTALCRLLSYNEQLDEKAATAVLYISSAESADIYLIKDNEPYLTREITLSADKVSQRIASELQVSFDYFKRQFADIDVKKIILAGEVEVPDLREFLSSQFGIPVQSVDMSKNVSILGDIPLGACIALGLALGGLEKDKSRQINLIPVALTPAKKEEVKKPAIKIGVLAVVALVFLGGFFGWQNTALNSQIKKLEASQPALDASVKTLSLDRLRDYNKNLTSKSNFLKYQTTDRMVFTDKLNRIPVLMPQEAWLVALTMEDTPFGGWEESYPTRIDTKISMKGVIYAGSRSQELKLINDFVEKLKNDPGFFKGLQEAEIKSSKVSKVKDKELTNFEINISSK